MPRLPLRARSQISWAIEVDLMIGLVHDSYRRLERGHRFLEAVEVDLTIRLVRDSYRRWIEVADFLRLLKLI
jgi:hypothetical protein